MGIIKYKIIVSHSKDDKKDKWVKIILMKAEGEKKRRGHVRTKWLEAVKQDESRDGKG